jgi:hypothetical protein
MNFSLIIYFGFKCKGQNLLLKISHQKLFFIPFILNLFLILFYFQYKLVRC